MLKGKERKMDWNGKWKERMAKMKEKEKEKAKKIRGAYVRASRIDEEVSALEF